MLGRILGAVVPDRWVALARMLPVVTAVAFSLIAGYFADVIIGWFGRGSASGPSQRRP